jgi:hypothetical protein
VAEALLAQVTNDLARWLPSDAGASALSHWDQASWLAAEWVVYWQSALPWFATRLRATEAPVPPDIARRILSLDESSRERTRCMLAGAVELLAALRKEGIEALPLKGAALAPLYYPDPLTRPLGDLDILVRPEDVARGTQVLESLGYRFYSRSAEDEVYLRGDRKDNVWAPDNVHPVEMHFALREEYAGLAYDLAGQMWRSNRWQAYWRGAEGWVPEPATLLHHVCAHATSDWLIQRGRLMHIADISYLTKQMQAADWEAFDAQIDAYGARFVYTSLAFVAKYAAIDIPDPIWDRLKALSPEPLRQWVARTELAGTSESNPALRDGIGVGIAGLLAGSPSEKRRMLLRSLFPRRWNLTKRYPRLVETPLWPLSYVLLNGDRAWQIARRRLGRP